MIKIYQALDKARPCHHNIFMPSRHRIKTYIENGYYHVYNRGVEKRAIYSDDQDYRVFLSFLKNYLSTYTGEQKHPIIDATGSGPVRIRPLLNFSENIDLIAYCLMPNHFHLLIKQTNRDSMTRFVQALCTSYSMYFNKKYNRVGPLFQGVYKAILVTEDPYLLHLSRYIHLNPREHLTGSDPVSLVSSIENYPYSSYLYYLGDKNASWIKPEIILSFFNTQKRTKLIDYFSYQSFIEDYLLNSRKFLGNLTID